MFHAQLEDFKFLGILNVTSFLLLPLIMSSVKKEMVFLGKEIPLKI